MLSFLKEEENYVQIGQSAILVDDVQDELDALGKTWVDAAQVSKEIQEALEKALKKARQDKMRDIRRGIACPICGLDARVCPWARARFEKICKAQGLDPKEIEDLKGEK